MTLPPLSLTTDPAVAMPQAGAAHPRAWLATAWRYGFSTSGPVAISGAHFLASLIFVRGLAAAEFGIFSFVLVIVPFAMSMIAAMLVLPVTTSLGESQSARARILSTCLKLSWLLIAAAGLGVFAFLLMIGAPPKEAALLAGFGAILTWRWFARCYAFVQGRLATAVMSDWIYAVALAAGLSLLVVTHHLSLMTGAMILLVAALAGLLPFGMVFFREQARALSQGRLGDYRVIFRDLTSWALLGVFLTEVTVNAHAYLVTFLSGPGSFALLAVGTILMRPASLVQSALPDLERPAMSRAIAKRDWPRLASMLGDFRGALLAVWLGTVLLAAALLTWFPQLLLKKTYAERDVILVTFLTAAIMMVRNFRTPLATFMQAAGEFKALARIGLKTSIVSVVLTLAFLVVWGPIASLLGILAGETMVLYILTHLAHDWKRGHV